MSQVVLIYVDDEGVWHASLDNPWGGETHITAETRASAEDAVERELRFISSHVNAPLSIAERIKELDCD